MNPDASTLALASIEMDIGGIAEGQIVTIKWRAAEFTSCGKQHGHKLPDSVFF